MSNCSHVNHGCSSVRLGKPNGNNWMTWASTMELVKGNNVPPCVQITHCDQIEFQRLPSWPFMGLQVFALANLGKWVFALQEWGLASVFLSFSIFDAFWIFDVSYGGRRLLVGVRNLSSISILQSLLERSGRTLKRKFWVRSSNEDPSGRLWLLVRTAWGQAGARANPRRSVLQLLVTPIFFISKQFCMKESDLETSKAFPLCINAQESCLETVRLFPLQKDKNALMHKNLTSRQ